MSPAQERLAFLQRLQPGNAAHHLSVAWRIDGALDARRLALALDRVIARHSALRTAIVETSGGLAAAVAPSAKLDLELVDYSTLEEPRQSAALTERLAEVDSAPFDLSRSPLMRAVLVRLGPDAHVLALGFHQLVADPASADVIAEELVTLYEALRRGDPSSLPPVALDYYDWVNASQADAESSSRDAVEARRQQLLPFVSALQLPTDRLRPPSFSYRGAALDFRLSPELSDAVRSYAAGANLPLATVLLAAFGVLLHRYAGQERLAIGVPSSSRGVAGSERLVGLCSNLSVIAADASGAPAFGAYVQRTNEELNAAHAQPFAFEQLLQAVNPARDFGKTPLFQALFSFEQPSLELASASFRMRRIPAERRFTRTDLCLLLQDADALLAGRFEYSVDLFDRESIQQLLHSFETLLDWGVAHPDTAISALPLLSQAERRSELERWNDTALPYERELTVVDRFEAQVRQTPDAAALHFGDVTLSYRELNQRVNRLAERLSARGARPGLGVAVALERSVDLVVSVLAILKCGAHYVPLDPRHPESRNARILEIADPCAVVTQSSVEEVLPEATRERRLVLDLCSPEASLDGSEDPPRRANAEGIAYIIFTSGSTGDPKGVEVSHGALTNFLVSMADTPGIRPSDRVLALTTISFDIAGLELYLPLTTGASIELVDTATAGNPKLLLERIAKARPTLVQATPATWQMLLDVGWRGDPSIRALCGGEAMSAKLAHELTRRVGELWNMYGPTETTVWSAVFRVPENAGAIPVGLPIHNTTIHVLDDSLEPVPRGVVGELFIGGDGVANGYHKQPELTAAKFVADPFSRTPGARLYRTGDLGRRRHDGLLEWVGRRDFQVKIRGFRIELGEVEAALCSHPSVEMAVATVQTDASGDKRIVAHLMLSDRTTALPEGLREHLQGRLPAYMLPSAMMALEAFPLTPNGKVDRKLLPEVKSHEQQARVAPESDLELSIWKIWTKQLGLADVGTHDDFFALGGHSLAAVRMLHSVHQSCGVEVPLATFFAKPTIHELASAVRQGGGQLKSSILELTRHREGRPLYFIAGIQLYQSLADELGNQFDCSGIILPIEQELFREGVTPGAEIRGFEVHELARRYVQVIREHQPDGPYWLGGVSFGGILAYEVARQLREQGAEVPLLIIIDSLLPSAVSLEPRSWLKAQLKQLRAEGVGSLVERARRRLRTRALAGPGAARVDDADDESLFRAARDRAYDAATEAYDRAALTSYAGRTLVVRAADAEGLEGYDVAPDLGWARRVRGELHLCTIPGDHLGILRPPYVQQLAAEIKRHVDPAPQRLAASASGLSALLIEWAMEFDTAVQLLASALA